MDYSPGKEATYSQSMRSLGVLVTTLLVLTSCGGGGGSTPPVGNNSAGAPPAVPTAITVAFVATPNAVAGLPQTFALNVVVKDQRGASIQGTYAQPVTLKDSDSTGATKLSAAGITSSTQAVWLIYSGARLSGPVTIAASMPGVPAANVTDATFNADSNDSYVQGDKFTYQRMTSMTVTPRNGPVQNTEQVDTVTVDVLPSPATFNGQSGLTDVVTWFVNSSAGISDTTHDYYAYAPGNPVQLLHYGWTDATVIPSWQETITSTLAYDAPSLIDELPQTAGATWSPARGSDETETDQFTDGSGTTYVDVSKSITAADGSYESGVQTTLGSASGPVVDYVQSAAKGDASFNYTNVQASNTRQPVTVSVIGGAPSNAGIPYQYNCNSDALNLPASPLLPVTSSSFATPAPGVTPSPGCFDMQTGALQMTTSISTPGPNWYPPNPVPLDQEQYRLVGTNVPIPTDCQVPASLATSANHLQYTQQLLDPVQQKLQVTQDSYFVSNVGLVCSLQTMNLARYPVASLDGTPWQQIHEDVVYTLMPSPNATALRRARNIAGRAGVLAAANIAFNDPARWLSRYRRMLFRIESLKR
jgi:hypothetical protein